MTLPVEITLKFGMHRTLPADQNLLSRQPGLQRRTPMIISRVMNMLAFSHPVLWTRPQQSPSTDASLDIGPVTTNYDRELVFYAFRSAGGAANCDWNDTVRAVIYGDQQCDYVQYTAGKTGLVAWNNQSQFVAVLATFRLSNAIAQAK